MVKSRAIALAPSGTGRGWRRGRGPGAGRWRRRRRRTGPAAPWWRPGEAAPVRYGGREGPQGFFPTWGSSHGACPVLHGIPCIRGSLPRGTLNTGPRRGRAAREVRQCGKQGSVARWVPRTLARGGHQAHCSSRRQWCGGTQVCTQEPWVLVSVIPDSKTVPSVVWRSGSLSQ